jgi:DHA1 family multidrug resistance protein-like MFS transporter
MEEFGVGHVEAILGISLYVVGYGLGVSSHSFSFSQLHNLTLTSLQPMIFSPLSEIPRFGRLSVYMITLFLLVILQIPTILATNYSTIMAARFLAGFVCAPSLSTGVATLSDVFNAMALPYAISLYCSASAAAPVSWV